MFREKEYQVKDIMEMYDISRDTIKYYETHGLICSKRKENGYRVFDEMNVRKLKKFWLSAIWVLPWKKHFSIVRANPSRKEQKS